MKCQIYRCNCRGIWTIQNRNRKVTVESLLLNGKWSIELKPHRRRNPKGFVVPSNPQDIILHPNQATLKKFNKGIKLIYDKDAITFNIDNGQYLFFAEDGACYLLNKQVQY